MVLLTRMDWRERWCIAILTDTVRANPHWRQQFTCPTMHVWKHSSFFGQEHTKPAATFILSECRSYTLCLTTWSYVSALLDKRKGAAIM
ncbi:hypothetical protein PoB_003278600 [Plakobranchus ocellatus]|uniref:Uncharacterized protein n=1 Tax=Plakobranchus ocellatus TaxID=259542 RepID=A0AAV4A4Y1_9GAST|nr:hypothetical protein PoB_003278600 [Plakobranchus ocellatus]